MSPVILGIAALFGVLILLALAGAVFWYLRRSSSAEEGSVEESVALETFDEAEELGEVPSSDEAKSPTQPAPAAAGSVPGSTPPPQPNAQGADGFDHDAGEKIRILIVDDNPDTRGNVGRLLYFEDDMEVIGQAINGRDGIEQAVELKPHIVLMDINMPDMDGITATSEMSTQAPFSQVIMMSVQAEQHYMKQAMAAGARDFQPKPFTADELINCIRRVYDIGKPIYAQLEAIESAQATMVTQAPPDQVSADGDAPLIALYSPKGGIGTSTLAANLAVALQREYGDVVLMDGDLQFGDILVHLNTKATRTLADLIHHGELDIELLPDIVLTHDSGLRLLLAPPQPEMADALTAEMVGEILKGLKRNFKMVVVDTNSKLSEITMTVLDNADYILLVTSPELPAIKSAKLFLELADLLEYDPTRLGVIINRANLSGGIHAKQIGKVLKLKHAYFIPHDMKLHAAISRGVAVTQADASAPSSRAIIDLARQVWQKVGQTEVETVTEAA